MPADVGLYLDLCEGGRVYEYLSDAAGSDLSRDAVKVKFYTEVFFGRSRHVTDFTRLFGREFPNVLALIRLLKRGDHALLACLMQNVEATLIIGNVCGRLMREFPHVPVVTIHDSVATTPPHAELVARLMRESFQRFGLTPSLKFDAPEAPATAARVA